MSKLKKKLPAKKPEKLPLTNSQSRKRSYKRRDMMAEG